MLATARDLTRTGELPGAMAVSFGRALAGLVVGDGPGFGLGLANGLSHRSERLTDTTLQMLRNVPHLAMIPLVILWFGIGEGAKLFLVALGVFFPSASTRCTASAASTRSSSRWAAATAWAPPRCSAA